MANATKLKLTKLLKILISIASISVLISFYVINSHQKEMVINLQIMANMTKNMSMNEYLFQMDQILKERAQNMSQKCHKWKVLS